MPSLSLSPQQVTRFQFAAALSRKAESDAAAQEIADLIRARLEGSAVDLACLFFSSHHSGNARTVAGVLNGRLGPRMIVGCSGEGVIGGREELETGPAMALWTASLPGVQMEPFRLTFSPAHDQLNVSRSPDAGAHGGSFLLFADPFSTPMQDVLTMLDHRYPGTAAVGGLAGGGQEVGENRLVLQDEVHDQGLVGVHVTGPVEIRPIISQGCRPIGERFVVTKAEHNVIHELSGTPALERLQGIVASLSPEDRRRAHRALHIGILIDEQRNRFERGDFLVRNLVGADQGTGAVAIGDVVQEGQTVQFHLRDSQSATEDLNLLLAADRCQHPRNPPLGALLFSCCGRGRGLFGRPHHDAEAVIGRLGSIPLAGFFAQGEIGPVGPRNYVHGYTASLAVFAERLASGTGA